MEEEKRKVCTECEKDYPATLEFFNKNKNGLYGLQSVCKSCRNTNKREQRKKEANDKKTITITISKEEYNSALKRAEEMNITINDYMKLGLLKNNSKYMIFVDENLTDNEAYELSKIGTNINQIAHVCNATGKVYSSDIKYLREMIEKCWRLMDKMYNKIDEIHKVTIKLNE